MLASSSSFIIDLANIIIFLSFEVYLQFFVSLKSIEFPMHAVAWNSKWKHFHSNASSFQIAKNGEFKEEKIIAFWKI